MHVLLIDREVADVVDTRARPAYEEERVGLQAADDVRVGRCTRAPW
ncbi:hypothetical protein ABZ644_03545 [Nocardiopsis alba]